MKTKKLISIIVFVFITINIESQTNFFQRLDENTLKIFYNTSADIIIEQYADYYRIATIDPSNFLFQGRFSDYDIKGNKIFSGFFNKGQLDGFCTYFYENGNVKEHGKYKSGIRDSLWTFYYPNKQIEKIIRFENGIPNIMSFFRSNGKQLIKNGTGEYIDSIYKDNGKTIKYKIKGHLTDGKLNGKWRIFGVTAETFVDGKFIKGFDVLPYTSPQQISLENILGFYCQENLSLFQNKFFCQSCIDDISWALYSIKANTNNIPYNTFLSKYARILDSLNITSLSQIIEFKVNKNGTIDNINSYQTNRYINKEIVATLLKSISWIPIQCNDPTEGFIYMMIVKNNGKMYLPQAVVITNNKEANFMVKQLINKKLLICH
ncbi:MAG: hypothetical protein GXO86_14980 [Chlorobi bacterium]|nr:hypothetical protein [Chlorobiota bacterium]